jgi:TRAP-type mannitol/chloroaromatic compound transport system permease large subunit
MILAFKILILIGLIAFPYVMYKKGNIDLIWNWGILLGVNIGSQFFQAKIDGELKAFELKAIQIHIFFATITMAYSVERPDIEIEE